MDVARPDLFESFLADYDAMQREEEEAKEDPVPPEETSGAEEPSEETEAASTEEETEKPEPPEENDLTLSVAEAVEEAVNKMENGTKEPDTKEPDKEVTHRILQDFGHKIGGARKDAYAAYQKSLEDALKEDDSNKKNTLLAYWPTPNYKKLLDSGVEPWKVSALRALRDSCPNTPARYYEEDWRDEVLTKLKIGVMVLKDEIPEYDFQNTLYDKANETLGSGYIFGANSYYGPDNLNPLIEDSGHYQGAVSQYILYSMMGHEQSLKDYYITHNTRIVGNYTSYDVDGYTLFHGVTKQTALQNYNAYKEAYQFDADEHRPVQNKHNHRHYFPVVFSQDEPEDLKPFLQKAIELDKQLKEHKKTKKKSPDIWVGSYPARKEPNPYFIYFKAPNKEIVVLKRGFKSQEDARDYYLAHREELFQQCDDIRVIPKFRHDKNEERTGKKRLEKDITPEDYMKTFGFYGVEFGNWVEGKARQQNLNESYTALLDLADALNVPTKALSLGGTLSLRFGSNGRGGRNAAMAHYEPDLKAINLTKKSGAGCLAHEWFHALDNYLGSKDNTRYFSDCTTVGVLADFSEDEKEQQALQRFQKRFERDTTTYPIRLEVRLGMSKARRAMEQSGLKKRSQKLDRTRTKPYWGTTIECMARTFEAYVKYELAQKGIRNDYLVNIRDENEWNNDPNNPAHYSSPYPLMSEMPGIEKGFQALFESLKTKELDNGKVELFSCSNYETVNRQMEESHLMTKAELTEEEKAFIKFAEKELSLNVRFFEGPKTLHGQCQENTIYLNRNTDKPLRWTFYHEAFHSLSRRDPKLYRDLLQHVEETKAITQKQIEAFRESHRAYDLPANTIKEELLANAFADLKQEAHQIHEMAETKPKLAVRLLTFTRRLARKVTSFFHEQEDALSMKQADALNKHLDSLANDMQVKGEQVLADKNFVLGLDNLPILPDEHQKLYSLRPYVGRPEKQQRHDIQMAKNLLKKYSSEVVQDVLQTLSPRRMEKGYTASVMKEARSMALAH